VSSTKSIKTANLLSRVVSVRNELSKRVSLRMIRQSLKESFTILSEVLRWFLDTTDAFEILSVSVSRAVGFSSINLRMLPREKGFIETVGRLA